MQKRSGAIILKDSKILLMFRKREDGRKYYVLPGGTVEPNESLVDTLKRELKEECNLDIIPDKIEIKFINTKDNREHNYFSILKYYGEIKLGGPELDENSTERYYKLLWTEISKLHEIKLKPDALKIKLIDYLNYK